MMRNFAMPQMLQESNQLFDMNMDFFGGSGPGAETKKINLV